MRMTLQVLTAAVLSLTSCTTIKHSPKYELGDDFYKLTQKGERAQRALVFVEDDTIKLYKGIDAVEPVAIARGKQLYFHKVSFDVDVMTVPFKLRMETDALPEQLNTDFNGNVYLGYRVDRFRVRSQSTPIGKKRFIGHRGLTAGAFGGIGSTAVTPWTTDNAITDEYYGCTLTAGLTVMAAFHNHIAGLGIGWDRLTGRDKDVWIYKRRPWFGLTVGINLN